MKKILISSLIIFAALFSGCSSDDSAVDDTAAVDVTPDVVVDDGIVTMTTGTIYTISASGVITRTSSSADVSVETDLSTNITTATLISGEATCTECTE